MILDRNRVVLVTGGGRGLGEATCRVLARAGWSVVVGDVREDAAKTVAAGLQDDGLTATSVHLDVTDAGSVSEVLRSIADEMTRLDAVVNNAGIDVTLPVEELSVEQWDSVLGVNLRGPFLVARSALPLLRRAGTGHIVNIVSTAAKRTWANASAYHASKWGLLGFTHALHVEGRELGVKVTAVVSGGMRTPFILERFPDVDQSTLQDPAAVANTVRFVLEQPPESVIPEVMVIPVKETSWP